MSALGPHRLYRIVEHDPPTLEDFMSDEDLGEPPPEDADRQTLRMWRGISVFATEAQARAKATRLPLGDYIAEVEVPPGADLKIERTGGKRARGHHTLWARPEEIARWVTSVVRVKID